MGKARRLDAAGILRRVTDLHREAKGLRGRADAIEVNVHEGIDEYCDAAAPGVLEELRSLAWRRPSGRGARTDLEAELRDGSAVEAAFSAVSKAAGEGCSTLVFDDVGVRIIRPGYCRSGCPKVRVGREVAMLRLGVGSGDRERRRELMRMVDQAGVTPERLRELLGTRKA